MCVDGLESATVGSTTNCSPGVSSFGCGAAAERTTNALRVSDGGSTRDLVDRVDSHGSVLGFKLGEWPRTPSSSTRG